MISSEWYVWQMMASYNVTPQLYIVKTTIWFPKHVLLFIHAYIHVWVEHYKNVSFPRLQYFKWKTLQENTVQTYTVWRQLICNIKQITNMTRICQPLENLNCKTDEKSLTYDLQKDWNLAILLLRSAQMKKKFASWHKTWLHVFSDGNTQYTIKNF